MPDGAICPTCGGLGWLRRDLPLGHPEFGQFVPCTACNRVLLARIEHLRSISSLRGRALRQYFETFSLEGHAASAVEAYNAALAFARDPAGWLVIHGPKGNGKSHLAAAVANYLWNERKIPVLFFTVPDLFFRLYQQIDSSRRGEPPDPVPLVDTACAAPLLILDDLGAEQSTPFTQDRLFVILDNRYRDTLPTMLITNEPLESLPGRIRSRLGERGFSRVVCNPAPDFRLGGDVITLSCPRPPARPAHFVGPAPSGSDTP